ncbi:MAG: hypothetical protein MZU97_23535 [Bacillus subtilis]|nr:hypothetical protein [Bacillus subtilis]
MNKQIALVGFALLFAFLFVGCSTMTTNAYQAWKISEDAEDFNGDRKIDETDYELFLLRGDYQAWRISDEAEDLNGDRKIDETDFELYLNPPLSDYEIWRASDAAIDLNEDSKINEADYALFLLRSDYQAWRISDEAEDLNGDRKIDEADFELYINPPLSEFELWLASDRAIDLNNDTVINEADYTIYLEFGEFVGVYQISNLSYLGANMDVGEIHDLVSIMPLFDEILFAVDYFGVITATIPVGVAEELADVYEIARQGLDHMSLTRISPLVIALDTHVIIDEVEVNFTFYLSQTTNGYSSSIVISHNGNTTTIRFDLLRIE